MPWSMNEPCHGPSMSHAMVHESAMPWSIKCMHKSAIPWSMNAMVFPPPPACSAWGRHAHLRHAVGSPGPASGPFWLPLSGYRLPYRLPATGYRLPAARGPARGPVPLRVSGPEPAAGNRPGTGPEPARNQLPDRPGTGVRARVMAGAYRLAGRLRLRRGDPGRAPAAHPVPPPVPAPVPGPPRPPPAPHFCATAVGTVGAADMRPSSPAPACCPAPIRVSAALPGPAPAGVVGIAAARPDAAACNRRASAACNKHASAACNRRASADAVARQLPRLLG
jgi:hypothetical protein